MKGFLAALGLCLLASSAHAEAIIQPFSFVVPDSEGTCTENLWPEHRTCTAVILASGGWWARVLTLYGVQRGVRNEVRDMVGTGAGFVLIRVRASDAGGVACRWSPPLGRIAVGTMSGFRWEAPSPQFRALVPRAEDMAVNP